MTTSETFANTAGEISPQPVQPNPSPILDFWGASIRKTFEFPGQRDIPAEQRQVIYFNTMNEGARARYQKMINHPLKLLRENNDAEMPVDTAGDRHALILCSVDGWRLFKNGEEVAYREYMLKEWLKFANPEHVDLLEKEIREANPWLVNELSADQIRKEIANLEVKLVDAEKREADEADFKGK